MLNAVVDMCNVQYAYCRYLDARTSASANAAADASRPTLEPDATVLDVDCCTDRNSLHGILPIPD